jgi:hypothetical protein
MERHSLKLTFGADMIQLALKRTIEAGLLCEKCLSMVESGVVRLSQSSFCPPCQKVIGIDLQQQAEVEIKRRLSERGIDPAAISLERH